MKKEEKIKEIRALFMNKLSLSILLSQDEFVNFCIKLTSFLNYSRDTILLNLNKEDIEIGLDNAINFFNNIGLTKLDLINTFSNNFSLLEAIIDPNFLNKYVLLSLGENEKNDARINFLQRRPRIYRKSLEEMYARYKLLDITNREFTVHSMIESNYMAFIDRFVSRKYLYSENQILSERMPLDKLISKFPVDYSFIQSLKNNEINKNVSFDKRVLSPDEKRMLAIKNYKKVNNLNELSALIDISTSSLQRYLNEDSKGLVSEKEYLEIKKWLINAKREGLKTGGTTSQELYNFLRDESGKFNGIKR